MNRELDGLPAFDAWNTNVGECRKSLPEGGVNLTSGVPIGRDAGALSLALDMAVGRNGHVEG